MSGPWYLIKGLGNGLSGIIFAELLDCHLTELTVS